MNAEMLKRVVRAISDGSQHDLQRLAKKIVDVERQTGHLKLADQLEAILNHLGHGELRIGLLVIAIGA